MLNNHAPRRRRAVRHARRPASRLGRLGIGRGPGTRNAAAYVLCGEATRTPTVTTTNSTSATCSGSSRRTPPSRPSRCSRSSRALPHPGCRPRPRPAPPLPRSWVFRRLSPTTCAPTTPTPPSPSTGRTSGRRDGHPGAMCWWRYTPSASTRTSGPTSWPGPPTCGEPFSPPGSRAPCSRRRRPRGTPSRRRSSSSWTATGRTSRHSGRFSSAARRASRGRTASRQPGPMRSKASRSRLSSRSNPECSSRRRVPWPSATRRQVRVQSAKV